MIDLNVAQNQLLKYISFNLAKILFKNAINMTKFFLKHPYEIKNRFIEKRNNLVDKEINLEWSNIDSIFSNLKTLTSQEYTKYNHISEFEHQAGRFLNMQKIAKEVSLDNLGGDVIEFGTWQGLGLCMLSQSFDQDTTFRNFIGIDSFQGLPNSSTIWKENTFNNTSTEVVRSNFSRYSHNKTFHKLVLIESLFNKIGLAKELKEITKNVSIIHFDADLGNSTWDALKVSEMLLNSSSQPVYYLFDDWGWHPDEVPEAFYDWKADFSKYNIINTTKICSTRYSRYYKVTTKNLE